MQSAAWENVHLATLELAKASPLKQRLTDAFSRYLIELEATAVPDPLRPEFEGLRTRMTCVRPLRGESAVAATVRKMSLEEADACAARIVGLLDRMHRLPADSIARANGKSRDEAGSRQRPVLKLSRG